MTEPNTLAGDAQRERALDRLREACAGGQLTLAEFSHRVDTALAARTLADLEPLTADLAAPAGYAPVPHRAATHRISAIMASTKQRGRWRAATQIEVRAVMGECKLDLSGAEVEGMEIAITATAIMGQIHIAVPAGTEVEMDGWAFMGTRSLDEEPGLIEQARHALLGGPKAMVDSVPATRNPVVRVTTHVLMGEVKIEHLP